MAAVLATVSVLMCAVLCGCGAVKNSGYQTSVSVPAPVAEDHEESVPALAPAAHSTVKDCMKSYRDGQKNNSEDAPSEDATSETGTVEQDSEDARPEIATVEQASGYDVEAVTKIADMTANIEKISYKRLCVVFTEDEYNPYDVTWNYGRKYDKFVKAVDDAGMWDVLFDAEFYKAHYPMLALQYHDNDALLLEHFQTVGVHEGRQGSEAFNVAGYMENCGDELPRVFGEHYECYYFYWALNQGSESGIDAESNGHPLKMCVKLTGLQAYELRRVNEYRAEVGAGSVEAAPELMAFACYRALCDYTGNYTAHEWFYAHPDYIDSVLSNWNAHKIAENTVCGKGPTAPVVLDYAGRYRESTKHYESMVNTKYHWFGYSSLYWGSDEYGKNSYKDCQYDVYLDNMSNYKIGTQ